MAGARLWRTRDRQRTADPVLERSDAVDLAASHRGRAGCGDSGLGLHPRPEPRHGRDDRVRGGNAGGARGYLLRDQIERRIQTSARAGERLHRSSWDLGTDANAAASALWVGRDAVEPLWRGLDARSTRRRLALPKRRARRQRFLLCCRQLRQRTYSASRICSVTRRGAPTETSPSADRPVSIWVSKTFSTRTAAETCSVNEYAAIKSQTVNAASVREF